MKELKEEMYSFFVDYYCSTVSFERFIWPKIEQLIESEKAKAVAEYKASLNVQYTPEQIGQRGPDDMNFNPLIPEKII